MGSTTFKTQSIPLVMFSSTTSTVLRNVCSVGENAPSEMSFKPQFVRIPPPLYQCEDEVCILIHASAHHFLLQ